MIWRKKREVEERRREKRKEEEKAEEKEEENFARHLRSAVRELIPFWHFESVRVDSQLS